MYITEHILIKINITYLKSSRNVVHSRFVQVARVILDMQMCSKSARLKH